MVCSIGKCSEAHLRLMFAWSKQNVSTNINNQISFRSGDIVLTDECLKHVLTLIHANIIENYFNCQQKQPSEFQAQHTTSQ